MILGWSSFLLIPLEAAVPFGLQLKALHPSFSVQRPWIDLQDDTQMHTEKMSYKSYGRSHAGFRLKILVKDVCSVQATEELGQDVDWGLGEGCQWSLALALRVLVTVNWETAWLVQCTFSPTPSGFWPGHQWASPSSRTNVCSFIASSAIFPHLEYRGTYLLDQAPVQQETWLFSCQTCLFQRVYLEGRGLSLARGRWGGREA